MALIITDDCINCGACETECPNTAIYEGGTSWTYSDGTNLSGEIEVSGSTVDADDELDPISDDFFFIVPAKCSECVGFHEEPQCAAVCPEDCCVPDPDHKESEEELQKKVDWMHN
ncbi:MAG: 4Fe-4S binding protein [Candidatus Cyclobacteriaceae bacterium M3_2C_046]